MANKVTRYIKRDVERELWARAGGRCQFQGCNELVYKSAVTQERVNVAEMAHIYSFSKGGPRGWGPIILNKAAINKVANLLLVCRKCHKTIDQDKDGSRYSAELLKEWKRQHEDRVRIITGICPTKSSHVILYGGKIGEVNSPLQSELAMDAMFPNRYPAEEKVLSLEMRCEHEDSTPDFWRTEEAHLKAAFERHIRPRIEEAKPNHFSIFARASQPLLTFLGTLLTDSVPAEVYQLHREPITWKWQSYPENFEFQISEPVSKDGAPVLVISLSAKIAHDRVTSVLGDGVSIWELSSNDCHNGCMRSAAQLSMFRVAARKLLVAISAVHGIRTPLSIFPAMPVSCAVELGRIRMPKADMPWIIYDQNNKLGKFIKTLEIGNQS